MQKLYPFFINIIKSIIIIFFIVATAYYINLKCYLGAWFSFGLIIFFTLLLFENNIKLFKFGNLGIELQKSIKFNKELGLKTANILLFLLNGSIGVFQSPATTAKNIQIIKESRQDIIKMLSDFGYSKTEIEELKNNYIKELN